MSSLSEILNIELILPPANAKLDMPAEILDQPLLGFGSQLYEDGLSANRFSEPPFGYLRLFYAIPSEWILIPTVSYDFMRLTEVFFTRIARLITSSYLIFLGVKSPANMCSTALARCCTTGSAFFWLHTVSGLLWTMYISPLYGSDFSEAHSMSIALP